MHFLMTVQYTSNRTALLHTEEGVLDLPTSATRHEYYVAAMELVKDKLAQRGYFTPPAVLYFQLESNSVR